MFPSEWLMLQSVHGGNYLAGDKRLTWHNGACRVPANFDEVVFPCHLARAGGLLIPFKSKIISVLQHSV